MGQRRPLLLLEYSSSRRRFGQRLSEPRGEGAVKRIIRKRRKDGRGVGPARARHRTEEGDAVVVAIDDDENVVIVTVIAGRD